MSLRTTKAAAAAMMLAGALAGCKSDTAESLLADARQYQQKGDNKAAVIQLKNALEKNPDQPQARFLLATIALQMEDALTAEKEARRALALKVPPAEVLPVLGKALTMQGKYQAALDDMAAAPDTPQVLSLRGNAYLGLGKTDEAKQAFDAALAGQPGQGDALTGLARLAASQQQWDDAKRLVEEAIAKNPRHEGAWQLTGDLLRVRNQPQEAMAAYREVLKINPAHRSAHLDQAELNIAARQYDAAQADIDAARKTTPNNFLVLHHQALLDFSRNNMKDAQSNLLKVMQVAPNHMPSVLLSGAVALNLGLLEQAEKDLRRYVEWNPTNLYARKMLVSTLLKTRQLKDAETVLAPALEDGKADASVLELAAERAMLDQRYQQAASYFQQAAQRDPQRGSVRTGLGLAKLALGDRAGGAAELEAAAKLAPGSLDTVATLVRAQTSMGEYDKALASIGLVEKAHPNSPVLLNLKGGAWLGKKDVKAARAAFDAAIAADPTYYPAVANAAQLDLQAKDTAGAKGRFEKLLAKDAKNADAMAALAQIALTQNDQAGATAWLEKAVAEQPDAVDPAIRLGEHYLATGAAPKALTLLSKYQVANADNAALLDLLGRVQMANKDANGAIETFSKLASVRPKSGAAQLRLATAQLARNNEPAAAEALKKAVAVEPDFMQAYVAQADVAMRKRDYEGALAIVRAMQQRFPKSPVALLLEGDLWMTQGKPAQAVRPYERAYALAPTAPMLMKLSKSLLGSGKAAEADRRVAEFRKQHPGEPLAAMYVAENLMGAKQYRQAIVELEGALRAAPDNVVALNNLALAYQQEKDSRALPTAEKAYKLASTHPLVMDTLGWLLVEQGNVARGMPLLREAARLAPDTADVRLHLAQALARSGDKLNARKELEYVLAKGTSQPQQEAARSLMKQL
ncbi:putative PEP-CTERM system TPR-repeat lipoprotein [Pseudoduganella flava]|uniref:PEP-CTERM system TPR-repeat protein PrsT n=1 Tax=Pseudoduganella flava TaxID=871742 RepID=A0A562PNM5_9BURK|nr:XrtA/PEP-CTERM system TPR-repeat protein PrsT [Pseudoduganella flava]QGZ40581.1 PEP-CTERM system TPR-repeat protein PrsT [Pseudoduganella flava]TWI46027.1 putative PEP-CTERM system TPR-repeat lipoprotein [Pseudoduganella flava]